MKTLVITLTDEEMRHLAAAQMPRAAYSDDSHEWLAGKEVYLLIQAHLRSLKNGVDMLAAFGHVELGRKHPP